MDLSRAFNCIQGRIYDLNPTSVFSVSYFGCEEQHDGVKRPGILCNRVAFVLEFRVKRIEVKPCKAFKVGIIP